MSKKKTKSTFESGPAVATQRKSVRLKFNLSSEHPPVFANQMMVQSDENTTYLSFFAVQPPVILGSDEEVQRQIEELEEVDAKLVAQVIVPRDRMATFIATMENTLNRMPTLRTALESGGDTTALSHR